MAEQLEKRRLGKTELYVTLFGFGSIKFPHISAQEAADALDRALDLGVNFIDTARGYGDSEVKIGPVLKRRRGEVYIATKTGKRTAEDAMAELETSLKNLQTDDIDLYQAHWVCNGDVLDQVLAPGGALEAFRKAKEQGKIRHYGITMHRHHAAIRRAIESDLFETIMLAYNPIDEEGTGPELIPLAAKHDMGVIIMKPLSGGLLVSPPGSARADGLDPVVAGTLRGIAINPHVTTVIPGMISVEQVNENYRAIAGASAFDEAARRRLFETIASMKKELRYGQLCLSCGYCAPCRQDIDIPTVFRALYMHQSYPEDQRFMGQEVYDGLDVPPDACEECGECLERCPAGIDIPIRLREAVAALGTVK
ncbi:MAG: aldo/keto reductase [Armatimonadota bacterium]|jgi:predicted aldo/keto reductase-like oxidoreductase